MNGMARLQWRIYVLVCCLVGFVQPQLLPSGCELSAVKAQPNFDIHRFLGRWNELMWVAPEAEKNYDSTDYFWQLSNSTQPGVIKGYQSGRDTPSGQCYGGPLTLRLTETPGVLLLDVNNATTRVYILETDYSTYANMYGCYDYDHALRTCHRGRAWLWARGSSLPEHMQQRAVRLWSALCLDIQGLLKHTPVLGNDCPVSF